VGCGQKVYDPSSWQYEGMRVASDMGAREGHAGIGDQYGPHGAKLEHGAPPSMDPSLTHPRCVFQLLKRHYRRYTPELVERACGVPSQTLVEVADKAMANLDWLVVRDLVEIESATFWRNGPEIQTGELQTDKIRTEVFLLPAAAYTEKDGSFTNTQRLLQWHHKAVEPPGHCRSDLWFYYHLGRIIRQKLQSSTDPKDRPVLDLAWDYPVEGRFAEPSAEAVLREISGVGPDGRALSGYLELKADGSTACGCWIYSGCYAGEVNQVARRKPGNQQSWVAPEWGWAWPYNRRILYNRASADPQGRPWSQRKRYVWWDEHARRWTGHDDPDFVATMPPDYQPPDDATAQMALAGTSPFVMQAEARAGCSSLTGCWMGRCPPTTSCTSRRWPIRCTTSRPTPPGRSSIAQTTGPTPPTASPAARSSPTW
jgi:anaerobic selenocysteine-containing dehydrogenase